MVHVDINLWDFVENDARRWPSKTAIKQGALSYTYAEFRERICRLSNYLISESIEFQDKVAVLSPNSIAFVELMFANAKLGTVTELLNWRLAPSRLCALLNASSAKLVFFSQSCTDTYNYLRENLSREVKFVCMDGTAEGAVTSLEAYSHTEAIEWPYRPTHEDMAIQIYSSGTTSMPKAMLHSVKNFVTKSIISINAAGWTPDDVYMLTSPLFHISCAGMFACYLAGGTMIIAAPTIDSIVKAINDDHVSRVGIVPSVLNMLLDYLEQHSEVDRSSVRYLEYGSAPMSAEQIERTIRLFDCKFLQYYGMTETVAHITILLPEHHLDPSKLRSVGLPVLGTQVRVIREDGTDCESGEVGEIITRHPCTIDGYLNNPEQSKAAFRGEWYCTGDIGYLDADGFVYLVDRKNDLIISGGENIYPKEVATCILSIGDRVKDVAVTGVPDEKFGETVMAAVVRGDDLALTESEIIEYCKTQLASYKKPRYVYFVDKLPLNDLGKVDKKAVKQIHLDRAK